MSFTWQDVLLALAPKATASLSLLGSSWILIEFATDPYHKLQHSMYHRIILGLSVVDFASSIAAFATTWPIPASDNYYSFLWSTGTPTTCTIQGMLNQFGIASPIYNACLAIYYLMVLRYQESESSSTDAEHFLWNVERLFHATAWSFGLVPALKAMHWKLYAATPTGCWIASPQQCDDDDDDNLDCDVRDEAWQFRQLWYVDILWICFGISTCCMILVYQTVKRREEETIIQQQQHDQCSSQRNNNNGNSRPPRYSFLLSSRRLRSGSDRSMVVSCTVDNHHHKRGPIIPPLNSNQESSFRFFSEFFGSSSNTNDNHNLQEDSVSSSSFLNDAPPGRQRRPQRQDHPQHQVRKNNHDTDNDPRQQFYQMHQARRQTTNSITSSSSFRQQLWSSQRRLSIPTSSSSQRNNNVSNRINPPQRSSFRPRSSITPNENNNDYDDEDEENIDHVLATLAQSPKLCRQTITQFLASQALYQQAIWYTIAFYVTYGFCILDHAVQRSSAVGDQHTLFWLQALHAMLLPLQGALNFVAYRRNWYCRVRSLHPEWSYWEIVQHVVRWSFLAEQQNHHHHHPGQQQEQQEDQSNSSAFELTSSSNNKWKDGEDNNNYHVHDGYYLQFPDNDDDDNNGNDWMDSTRAAELVNDVDQSSSVPVDDLLDLHTEFPTLLFLNHHDNE